MSWLLLALSLAIFCIAWSVHSPVLMVICLLAALAALVGFAWLRYKILFPERAVAIDDTPLSAEDVRRMRDAQVAANSAAAPLPLPAASQPDANRIRAAAERVAEQIVPEPAPVVATPPALPPQPQSNLRDEGWNPYAGEVHVAAKRPVDAKASGLDVPMLTPLRDEPDPT